MGILGSAARLVRRQSVKRGLFGGNRAWMTVGGVYSLIKVVRRISRRADGVVTAERIAPGETLIIETVPRTTRRQRRAAKRG